jgi:hypothetical protein
MHEDQAVINSVSRCLSITWWRCRESKSLLSLMNSGLQPIYAGFSGIGLHRTSFFMHRFRQESDRNRMGKQTDIHLCPLFDLRFELINRVLVNRFPTHPTYNTPRIDFWTLVKGYPCEGVFVFLKNEFTI